MSKGRNALRFFFFSWDQTDEQRTMHSQKISSQVKLKNNITHNDDQQQRVTHFKSKLNGNQFPTFSICPVEFYHSVTKGLLIIYCYTKQQGQIPSLTVDLLKVNWKALYIHLKTFNAENIFLLFATSNLDLNHQSEIQFLIMRFM